MWADLHGSAHALPFLNLKAPDLMKVTAVIHLLKQSRYTNARVGGFLRPDKAPHPSVEGLHLWQGRELTADEFNEQFQKAIASVPLTPSNVILGRCIVRTDETDVPAAPDAAGDLQAKFDAQVAEMQAGVDRFVAEHNASLQALQARVAELEAELATRPAPALEERTESPSITTAPSEPLVEVEAPTDAAGATSAESSTSSDVPADAPPADAPKPAAKKKAKK